MYSLFVALQWLFAWTWIGRAIPQAKLRREFSASFIVLMSTGLLVYATLWRGGAVQEATLLSQRAEALMLILFFFAGACYLVRSAQISAIGPRSLLVLGFILAWHWLPSTLTEGEAVPREFSALRGDWPDSVLAGLRDAAAGTPDLNLSFIALAACHGAEVATLRALCPKVSPPAKSHLRPKPGSYHAFGLELCQAVAMSDAEAAAHALGCVPHLPGDTSANHRCRVAGELFAEAGMLEQAWAVLADAHEVGVRRGQALLHALHRPVPQGFRAAPLQASWQLWPDARTIGPAQLGFAQQEAPGDLTWHPLTVKKLHNASWHTSIIDAAHGSHQQGVLWARSRYQHGLATRLPPPPKGALVRGATIVILARQDLQVRLAFGDQETIYSCMPVMEGASPNNRPLPPSLCRGEWTQLDLCAGNPSQSIETATLNGEFMLAHWRWRGDDEVVF